MISPEPIETVSAVEAVASRLRSHVLDGGLTAGEQVTEGVVAGHFGVSRPTAKSAITTLVNEGLLRREANKPAYVPRLSRDDVKDLFLVRIPLELEVVRLVVARGRVPVEAAAAVRDIGQVAQEAPTSQFVEADLRFHRLLVESVASHRLTRLYRSIQGEIHLSMVQSRRVLGSALIAKEHGEVLTALQAGNQKEAASLMRGHLERACAKIAEWVDEVDTTHDASLPGANRAAELPER